MKGSWAGSGTWETSGGSGGGLGWVVVVLALLLIGSGAAAEIVRAVAELVAALVGLALIGCAVLAAVVLYRTRQPRPAAVPRPGTVQATVIHRQSAPAPPAAQRPAIEAPAPGEVHLHFHGIDPEQVAELLRRRGEGQPEERN